MALMDVVVEVDTQRPLSALPFPAGKYCKLLLDQVEVALLGALVRLQDQGQAYVRQLGAQIHIMAATPMPE